MGLGTALQLMGARGRVFAAMLLLLWAPTLHLAAADVILSPGMENWSYDENGAFRLGQGWTVYRGEIIAPDDFSAGSCAVTKAELPVKSERVSLPDLWGPAISVSLSAGHGAATYCQTIILPDTEKFYSLRMGTLRSVSHIYAIYSAEDGQKRITSLHKNGALDAQGGPVVNNPAAPTMVLPYGISNITLVVQLSNRIHKQGGIVEVPTVDLKWRLDAADNRATGLPSALVIILLFVAVGGLIVGRHSHEALDHQLFSFVAAAAALRAALVSDLIWDYVPDFDLARKYDLEYLSLFLVAFAYYAFVNRLLRPGKRLWIDNFIYGVTGSLIIFAIFLAPFFPPGTITLVREPVQLLWGMIVLMVIYSVFRTSVGSPERRREAMVVSLAALIYASYEILSSSGTITASMEWSQFIIFVVVMVHAQIFVMKARETETERDGLMGSLQDANQTLKNRALTLDFALKRAEEASKAKSNFLATFSHELRTPLNAIIGFSEVMMREVFGAIGNKHYGEYARDIHSSGTHLLGLVDDILDLSSTQAGAGDLADEEVDICTLVDETLSLLKIQAARRKISMTSEHALEVPLLRADERKIKQVLINLVSNAVKFNKEKGAVNVNIHADETGLYIDVQDTGIGIAEEHIPLVLSRFGRAQSSDHDDTTGVGIGLPLSEVLVRQHGGEMKLTSKLGEGTCVGIWLPPERLVRGGALTLG